MALEKVVYTAHATATGGRDGKAVIEEGTPDGGTLELKLDPPPAMGGKGAGTNPEQLFAAGYAACFIGALKFVAGQQKIAVPADASIQSSVSFGPVAAPAKGFGIAVALEVHLPGVEKATAERLVHDAHEVCPYSNATRGNVDVTLTVA